MKLRTLLREVSQKINIGTKNRDQFDDLINIVGDNFQSSLKGDFPGISFY